MGKALPILGIAGAVFALLAMMVLVSGAAFIVLPLALAGSIVLLAQRNVAGAVAGIVVLGLMVLAALGLSGSVTTKNGSTAFGISEDLGRVLAAVSCLAIPVAATIVRWGDVEPAWLAWLGLGGAALAAIVALAAQHELTEQFHVATFTAGLASLLPIAPMVALLRAPADLPGEA